MFSTYFNELKKYKILLFTLIGLLAIGFLGTYSFKKIRKHIWDNRFEQALEEAAKIDPSSWDEKYKLFPIKDKYKAVIVVNNGGEYSYAEYFQYAAQKLGWEVNIYIERTFGYEKEILKFDPDFIIYFHQVIHDKNQNLNMHRSKKYLMSFLSLDAMKNIYNLIDKRNPYKPIGNLEAHISTSHAVLTSEKEIDVFSKMFARWNKPFNGMQVLPLAPATSFSSAEPKDLMWISSGWDNFRSSSKYRSFIQNIASNIPLKVYGRYNNSPYLQANIYDGCLPSALDIYDTIRKHGIYLLTHSKIHIDSKVPTLRIFEAAASNAVIISDKHPFVIENFGNNVLYFDHEGDAETMYKQVKSHYDWIKKNPEEAKAMADRAHKIFLEKFTLEKDLIRIAKMHEYIIAKEKEMGLTYPVVY